MRKLSLPIFLGCFFQMLNLNLFAQNTATPNARFSDLTLEIASTQRSFIQLEPIPIIFKLSNNTNTPIVGHASFRFSSDFIEIFVRNPNGLTKKVEPLSLDRIFSVGKETEIPRGVEVRYTEVLKLDLNRHFPLPGTYALQAVFRSRRGSYTIQSAWMTISITEPHGADLAAYEFLKQGTNISRAFNMPETDEQRNFFEAFVANYADTPYAPYIQLNLAEYYVFVNDFTRAKTKMDKLLTNKSFVLSSRVIELKKELDTKQKVSN